MLNNPSRFSHLFDDPGVRTIVSPLLGSVDELLPQERKIVATAVEKRQREFATARIVVRQLLAELSIYRYPLLNDADRVPIWPEGLIGSISHCNECCLVAIQKKNNELLNIGVDVEPFNPIEENLWSVFATEQELKAIKLQGKFDIGCLVHLLFSAKEAVYKCIFPETRTMMDFQDIEIEFDFHANKFYPTIFDSEVSEKMLDKILTGRFQQADGFIFTSSSLRQNGLVA